ncbi:MAG: hypothetical protein ABI618_17295 [Nitrospirota bacterium]
MRRRFAPIDLEAAGRTPVGMDLTTEQQQNKQSEVQVNRLDIEKVVTRTSTENVGESAALDLP